MYSDFEILKAFLLILRRSGFGKNGLPYNIPVRGQLTPINSCFDVLRKFLPEEFKEKSNKEILKYLRQDYRSAERLVATHFNPKEAQELMTSLEETPDTATLGNEQSNANQGSQLPEAASNPTPGTSFGMPVAPSISSAPRPVFKPQQSIPLGGIEGGAGEGLAATNKIDRLEAERVGAATAKSNRLNLQAATSQPPTQSITPSKTAPAETSRPRSSAPRRLNFSALRSRAFSAASPLMNKIAGSAGPAIKKGLGGIRREIMGIGRNGLEAAAPALGRTFNKGLDGLDKLTNPRRPNFGRRPRIPKLSSKFTTGRKVALVLLLFFIVFMGMLVIPPGGNVPTGQAAPLPSTTNNNPNSNLSSCQFTRSGVSNPIRSSTLASFFTEVEAKTGVPAAALASLAMHETASFVVGADNNHDGFGSNITSTAGCAHFATSPTGALGLMQIQPPKHIHDILAASGAIRSFESVGAYSADGVGRGAGFIGKTPGTLTLQDFCDIKTSIYLGAGVLISKNGGKPPTTGVEINKSVCGYYGSCVYGQHNYGDEAQKDFENCKPTAGASPAPPGPVGVSLTCPLDGSTNITCGTAANPASTGCGHGVPPIYTARCNPYYYACDTLSTKYGDGTYEKYSPGLYYAIDVTGRNEVKLPYINGNESVVWTRTESQPIYIGKNAEWGYRVNFTTTYQGKKLYLDLTHLSAGLNNAPSLSSGEIIGRHLETSQIKHLHIGLSIDGQWVEPAEQAKMCVQ